MDKERTSIVLPYPPTVNHYWGVNLQSGKRYIKAGGKSFRDECFWRVKAARSARFPFEGSVAVHIAVYPPDARRRDLDNVSKATLDALQIAGVFLDDAQVSDLRITRQQVKDPGCVYVQIEPAPDVIPGRFLEVLC